MVHSLDKSSTAIPSCDNQKRLQTLPPIPWWTNSLPPQWKATALGPSDGQSSQSPVRDGWKEPGVQGGEQQPWAALWAQEGGQRWLVSRFTRQGPDPAILIYRLWGRCPGRTAERAHEEQAWLPRDRGPPWGHLHRRLVAQRAATPGQQPGRLSLSTGIAGPDGGSLRSKGKDSSGERQRGSGFLESGSPPLGLGKP